MKCCTFGHTYSASRSQSHTVNCCRCIDSECFVFGLCLSIVQSIAYFQSLGSNKSIASLQCQVRSHAMLHIRSYVCCLSIHRCRSHIRHRAAPLAHALNRSLLSCRSNVFNSLGSNRSIANLPCRSKHCTAWRRRRRTL
jgi:hypothetical protein